MKNSNYYLNKSNQSNLSASRNKATNSKDRINSPLRYELEKADLQNELTQALFNKSNAASNYIAGRRSNLDESVL